MTNNKLLMKNWFRKHSLKTELQKNKRKVENVSFTSAKNIAIIASVNNSKQYNQILKITSSISKIDKKVAVIVYINKKEIPSDFPVSENVTIIKKDELNWYGKPKSDIVNDILKKQFDLLFEFDIDKLFAVEYSVVKSKAKLRVGSTKGNVKYLDFMIEQQNDDVHFLFDEAVKYLDIIKK